MSTSLKPERRAHRTPECTDPREAGGCPWEDHEHEPRERSNPRPQVEAVETRSVVNRAQEPTPSSPVRRTRGTTNRNVRGSTEDRRRRRVWLVETWRADVDATLPIDGEVYALPLGTGWPACRCYRCGVLLTEETVSADRIIPGCRGGTYRRDNIRPACPRCQSVVGGGTRRK